MPNSGEVSISVLPKPKYDILKCQFKDFQFTMLENEQNQEIFMFKELELENKTFFLQKLQLTAN